MPNIESRCNQLELGHPLPQLPDPGTFKLVPNIVQVFLHLEDVLQMLDFTATDGTAYHALGDRDTAYFLNSKFEYAGVRVVLDDKGNPIIRIEDHKDGSLFIDAQTNNTLMEWHTDAKDGIFSKKSGDTTYYLDRFMNSTPWSSFDVNGSTIYAKDEGELTELYESSFKPLNIGVGKSSSGKTFWVATDADGLSEYFDDSLKPLNWFSVVRDGRIFYAHVVGKKVKVYDATMHPIEHKNAFWAKLGRGVAVGLTAYAQARQAQAAANQQDVYSAPPPTFSTNSQQIGGTSYSTTMGSDGSQYSSTTQTIGNFDYSTTTGSNGYNASTTNQHIGNFGYISGSSSNGSISGMSQRVGSFNYSSYVTPGGNWTGTSQQMGSFTFHTITSPDGSVHTGTTQRIGDFLFTNIN